jgi:hypothetical protein
MPVDREQDREMRRNEERVVEEIRRLFERYRMTARQATAAPEHDQELEAHEEAPALTLR